MMWSERSDSLKQWIFSDTTPLRTYFSHNVGFDAVRICL